MAPPIRPKCPPSEHEFPADGEPNPDRCIRCGERAGAVLVELARALPPKRRRELTRPIPPGEFWCPSAPIGSAPYCRRGVGTGSCAHCLRPMPLTRPVAARPPPRQHAQCRACGAHWPRPCELDCPVWLRSFVADASPPSDWDLQRWADGVRRIENIFGDAFRALINEVTRLRRELASSEAYVRELLEEQRSRKKGN